VHQPFKIKETQMNEFVELLLVHLGKEQPMDQPLKARIFQLLDSLRGEILRRPPSLYERIGGDVTIPLVMQKFTAQLVIDPKLNDFFQHVNADCLQKQLSGFFSMLTGGKFFAGCKSLVQVHSALNIGDEHFDLFSALLKSNIEAVGAEK